MGLDQYLSKKTYVKKWSHQTKEQQHTVSVKVGGKTRKDIKLKRISHIVEDVMYWRKSNSIHSWFVQNCQHGNDNCGEYYVSIKQLEKLASLCEEVVKTKNTSLLETQGGFLFGSTDYDEKYFDDCKRTTKELRKLLKEKTPEGCYGGDFYYQSSW